MKKKWNFWIVEFFSFTFPRCTLWMRLSDFYHDFSSKSSPYFYQKWSVAFSWPDHMRRQSGGKQRLRRLYSFPDWCCSAFQGHGFSVCCIFFRQTEQLFITFLNLLTVKGFKFSPEAAQKHHHCNEDDLEVELSWIWTSLHTHGFRFHFSRKSPRYPHSLN